MDKWKLLKQGTKKKIWNRNTSQRIQLQINYSAYISASFICIGFLKRKIKFLK